MKGKTEEESKIQGAWDKKMQILRKEGCHLEQLYTNKTGEHSKAADAACWGYMGLDGRNEPEE